MNVVVCLLGEDESGDDDKCDENVLYNDHHAVRRQLIVRQLHLSSIFSRFYRLANVLGVHLRDVFCRILRHVTRHDQTKMHQMNELACEEKH